MTSRKTWVGTVSLGFSGTGITSASGSDMIRGSQTGIPLGRASGKLPYAVFELLLAGITLVAHHGNAPGVSREIAFVKRLPTRERGAGNIPGNTEQLNAFVRLDIRALVIARNIFCSRAIQFFATRHHYQTARTQNLNDLDKPWVEFREKRSHRQQGLIVRQHCPIRAGNAIRLGSTNAAPDQFHGVDHLVDVVLNVLKAVDADCF